MALTSDWTQIVSAYVDSTGKSNGTLLALTVKPTSKIVVTNALSQPDDANQLFQFIDLNGTTRIQSMSNKGQCLVISNTNTFPIALGDCASSNTDSSGRFELVPRLNATGQAVQIIDVNVAGTGCMQWNNHEGAIGETVILQPCQASVPGQLWAFGPDSKASPPPAIPAPTAVPTSDPAPASSKTGDGSSKGVPIAAIAGGAGGGIVFIVAILVCLLCHKRRPSKPVAPAIYPIPEASPHGPSMLNKPANQVESYLAPQLHQINRVDESSSFKEESMSYVHSDAGEYIGAASGYNEYSNVVSNYIERAKFVALHQYIAQSPEDLSLEAGDIVEVLSQQADGWWFGRVSEREGLFPSTYVQLIE